MKSLEITKMSQAILNVVRVQCLDRSKDPYRCTGVFDTINNGKQ
jgi:hypothetical protein